MIQKWVPLSPHPFGQDFAQDFPKFPTICPSPPKIADLYTSHSCTAKYGYLNRRKWYVEKKVVTLLNASTLSTHARLLCGQWGYRVKLWRKIASIHFGWQPKSRAEFDKAYFSFACCLGWEHVGYL